MSKRVWSLLSVAAGVALCVGAWLTPQWSQLWPFSDHMVRHMAVVAAGTPLIALGLGASMPRWRLSPLPATVFEFVVVWGWHLPVAHTAAQTSILWAIIEQLSFFIAGMAIWTAVLDPARRLAGAGGLLLTSMHMTLLGALLILAQRQLYPAAVCGSLADQQLGGMLMLGIGTPIYLIVGLVLVARELADRTHENAEPA